MKRKAAILIVILMFILGVIVILYPIISSIMANINVRNESQAYIEEVEKYDDETKKKLLAEAEAYNKSLTDTVVLTDPFDVEAYTKIGEAYNKSFNVSDDGLIGYVEIPKIDVYLPIFHGTSEEVLSKGAGHLQNTSFPIGGISTHSIISAHTAYPTETFFDYLTDMETGDMFYIYVLGETLAYKVDKTSVIVPEDTNEMRIIEGEDYVTLLTCTPYSVNTHRLLVRGTCVPYEEILKDSSTNTISTDSGSSYWYVMGYRINKYIVMGAGAGIVLIVTIFIIIAIYKPKSKGKRYRKETGKSQIKDGD